MATNEEINARLMVAVALQEATKADTEMIRGHTAELNGRLRSLETSSSRSTEVNRTMEKRLDNIQDRLEQMERGYRNRTLATGGLAAAMSVVAAIIGYLN